MNKNDINGLDPQDIGLQGIMGERFRGGSQQSGKYARPKEGTASTPAEKMAQKPTEAQWEPIKEHSWMDDLKEFTKTSFLFGGLNLLIWYWQIAGLMDESIALPCMLVCAAMFGLGIGKCIKRGKG